MPCLPDSASSARWETADRRFLEEAFEAAGVDYDIQNAEGDTAKFQTIADGMINAGVDALLIVNLDSETTSCGAVGCCDDSPNKHASAHARSTRHPIIEALVPVDRWRYCYLDETLVRAPMRRAQSAG